VPATPLADADILAAARALGGVARGSVDLWRELSDPLVEPPRIAAVLHADPGIAARVLKVANSAFYGRGRQVSSIDRAIVVLGLDAVRGIAAAAGLDRVVPRGTAGAAFAAHSAVVACASRMLARRHAALAPADGFLGGLLHDFGMLVAWRLAAAGRIDEIAADSLHVHCGALVLDAWQLPPAVVEAAARHHASGGGPLAACVRLAHAAACEGEEGLAAEASAASRTWDDDLGVLGFDRPAWAQWLQTGFAAARSEGRALAA
jgi:HD-like signal output (HDOD) protein